MILAECEVTCSKSKNSHSARCFAALLLFLVEKLSAVALLLSVFKTMKVCPESSDSMPDHPSCSQSLYSTLLAPFAYSKT